MAYFLEAYSTTPSAGIVRCLELAEKIDFFAFHPDVESI